MITMAYDSYFTGETFRAMVSASALALEEKQTFLDSINVFPIPDGDTGINLTSTLKRVVMELNQYPDTMSIETAAKTISRGSFMGAKGNSGVILSQFMMGMSSKLQTYEEVTPLCFAESMIEGSDWAYRAVLNPREGTILTVVRETASAAVKAAKVKDTWIEVIQAAYKAANKSTKDTPNLLPVLKDAGVVDAGAQGFVYILGSWMSVLSEHLKTPLSQELLDEIEENELQARNINNLAISSVSQESFEFQYCTECIVLNPSIEADGLKTQLEEYGDSLFCVQGDEGIKIHIHTNEPEVVFEQIGEYGELVNLKVDDMEDQHTSLLEIEEED